MSLSFFVLQYFGKCYQKIDNTNVRVTLEVLINNPIKKYIVVNL